MTNQEFKNDKITLYNADCLEKLKELESNSVDSIVTDPPYELGFMGKSWDNTGIANNKELWAECLRVLKHGGHLLAFGGTRTYHRMASAIEDAGFEVRDMIEWVYGSGFPKSLNIGKAVDKLQGNEREVTGSSITKDIRRSVAKDIESGKTDRQGKFAPGSPTQYMEHIQTKGTSEWEGWGTALKPAHEPICMARKPLEKGLTVAENCLKWGTGGINIDESRVETTEFSKDIGTKRPQSDDYVFKSFDEKTRPSGSGASSNLGRFPANLIHDNSEEVRECFPESKSTNNGGMVYRRSKSNSINLKGMNEIGKEMGERKGFSDQGNASRFFKSIIYQAKASKSDRNEGCEGMQEKEGLRTNAPRENEDVKTPTRQNNHPTVKPVALMQYLIKMITPKGGTVLDLFMGSGSTGKAAIRDGFSFIGIEKEAEYFEIAKARIKEELTR